METISVHYKEDKKTKKWFDKNLNKQKQSSFIREATKAKIEASKKK